MAKEKPKDQTAQEVNAEAVEAAVVQDEAVSAKMANAKMAQEEAPAEAPAAEEKAKPADSGKSAEGAKPAAVVAHVEKEPPAAAEKEKNFVSAVVYLGEEKASTQPFLEVLCGRLSARFSHYELVFVDDASHDGTTDEVRAFLAGMKTPPPVTMIHLSLKQGLEPAMNAGLDMAVGDFVYEFDSMEMPWPESLIDDVYDKCLAGHDIVNVSPEKNRSAAASLFYSLFNRASKSRYPLRTNVFRILSRRAINRVHSISATMPYRKAAYAASGLKMATLTYVGGSGGASEHLRLTRAVDSLTLYTNLGSKVSLFIAIFMLVLMIGSLVYTLAVVFTKVVEPVPGWTTTMLLLTGGFFGVFLILAMVLKYLSLLTEMMFHKQSYLVESVEKLS